MRNVIIVIFKIFLAIISLFGIVFSIYIFNFDMKFMAYVVDPFMQKIYDTKTRNQYV